MRNFRTVIGALGALGLMSCAAPLLSSAPPAVSRARIVLAPSDETYRSALRALSPQEQTTIQKGLGFTVDTLLTAPTPVETMTWSRRRPDTPSRVNIADYVRYIDLQPCLGGGARVDLATARVLVGLTYNQAKFDPVFRIEMEVEPSSGNVLTATALGAGPVCKRPADESPLSTKFTESQQIAFMKAFLKTLLDINDQLQRRSQ